MTKDAALKIEMSFGKHKGKTLGVIYEEDLQYLKWLYVELNADQNLLLWDALDVLVGD